MNIKHKPIFDTKVVEDYYSKKDGVPIKYVCTSALGNESYAGDIFYRDTPHPEFGNKYFQLFFDVCGSSKLHSYSIRAADQIENYTFTMIYSKGLYYYSQHRHDFVSAGHGFVDGGRAYTRIVGSPITKDFKIVNGNFEEVNYE